MDPGTLAFLLVVWLLKNAVVDVTCAVKGTPNPRYQAKAANARAMGRRPAAAPRYGSRDYWADLWADYLVEKTEIRRRRAARKRQIRVDADRMSATLPWDAPTRPGVDTPVPDSRPRTRPRPDPAAETQTSTDPTRGCTATLFAAPHPYEFDLDTASGPAYPEGYEMCGQSADDPAHQDQAAAGSHTEEPTLRAWTPRIVRNHEVAAPNPATKGITMTVASGEVTGLDQSIAYADDLARHAGTHGPAGNEGYIGHLLASKVSGACLQSAHDMQAAQEAAQAAAEIHKKHLQQQAAVQEQYDANPDAGDKDYQQQGR